MKNFAFAAEKNVFFNCEVTSMVCMKEFSENGETKNWSIHLVLMPMLIFTLVLVSALAGAGKMRKIIMAINIAAAFTTQPKPLDFVLPGFLAGTVGALVAPGSTGKSFCALQLAMGMACNVHGGDLLGVASDFKNGRVVYLAGEDSADIIAHRIHAIGKHLSMEARQSIVDNLTIESLVGRRLDVMNIVDMNQLVKGCRGARLVVFDTLSRIHTLNELDNGEMSLLISQLEYLATQTGASVLFLHHTNKGSALGGTADQQQAARGASAIIDNARWAGFLQKMTKEESERLSDQHFSKAPIGESNRKKYVKFGISKQNYGEMVADRWFKHHDGGVLLPVNLLPTTKKQGARNEI